MVVPIKFIGSTYKTPSNRRIKVITPSKKISFIREGKKVKPRRCHQCEKRLIGIKVLRPAAFLRLPVSQRRVNRPYGSTHCSNCVQKKIVSAFLNEEQKILTKN
ncbi:hypothetical protein GINT2_002182 [Glugoides intestinalis]